MAPVIDARGIRKAYREGGQEIHVLHGVDLAVAAGEIVVLEGPSGSGKTTLLSILGCVLAASAGTLALAGRMVDAAHPAQLAEVRRSRIGFVFQQFNLFPALNATENVAYALSLRGIRGAAARTEAARLIAAVGLADRAQALPRDLSGGQKQRVAIARALAGGPPVILADEPTANLDLETGERILDLFAGLARREGRSLVVVTHDPRLRRVADRVLALRDGRIA
jgi:putative ABC transport system ATP-binding protein